MPSSERIALSLALEPGGGPIAGVLESHGVRTEFYGWIEFVALIEARRAADGRAELVSPPQRPAGPPAAPPAS